ncbi:hypothetical protein ACKKBG_A28580 [Auxenochlorella protothecoides x Auxenochlorella symbiontica]
MAWPFQPQDGSPQPLLTEWVKFPSLQWISIAITAADLREGPCGTSFSGAFRCFIKSEHPDKGMDCIPQFKAFQECLQKHPEHVEGIMDDAEAQEDGEQTFEPQEATA